MTFRIKQKMKTTDKTIFQYKCIAMHYTYKVLQGTVDHFSEDLRRKGKQHQNKTLVSMMFIAQIQIYVATDYIYIFIYY